MGFFNKLKNMAEKAFNDDDDDDVDNIDVDDDDDDPSQRRVQTYIVKEHGFKTASSLQTPPPPATPARNQEALSVYIAVAGKKYGPYERATLLEMISNGALAKDTMVFMDGMVDWQAAKDVEKVNALFVGKFKVPEKPPIPWQSSQSKSEQSQISPAKQENFHNGLSAKLNHLIIAAVADGEISDLERQVLIRNAQAEDVPMDEFVMVLESKLYERRQELLKEQKAQEKREEERELNAKLALAEAQAKVAAASKPTQAPTPTPSKPTKCQACGAPIKILASRCPECGTEYRTMGIVVKNSWYYLCEKLEAIDRKFASSNPLSSLLMNGEGKILQEKVQAIKQCTVTNAKEDLVDFFSYCAPLAQKSRFSNIYSVEDAYYKKAQQVLNKAYIVLADSPDMLKEIEMIAVQYKIKR